MKLRVGVGKDQQIENRPHYHWGRSTYNQLRLLAGSELSGSYKKKRFIGNVFVDTL